MAPEAAGVSAAGSSLQPKRVFELGAVCLIAGLAIGYVCAGSSAVPPSHTLEAVTARPPANTAGTAHPVSLADMKRMADQQAEPLLRQLSSSPGNTSLLVQLGAIYHVTHQYREAAAWYQRAVQSDPRNAGLRTKLATSLYRQGDVDGALAQLNEALKIDPRAANALFDLGMIRLQGKADARGAVAAWRQLLKSNPQLSPDRRASVEKLIADTMASLTEQGRSAGQ